jgi:capsular exopolysaccharide synthesis family protein
MTTLPQTTAIRLPRPATPSQMIPAASALGPGAAAVSNSMNGGDVWRVIRSNVWFILFMLVIATGAGYFVNRYLANHYPRYTSAGYIQVTPYTKDVMLRDNHEQNMDSANLTIEQKTQATYLLSETLLTQVLQNTSSKIRETQWFKKFNGNVDLAKEDFIDNYSVRPLPETRLVKVEFTNAVPADCQAIVMELGNQHIKDEADRIFLEGQARSQSLSALRSKFRLQFQETDVKLIHLRSQVSTAGGGLIGRVNQKESEIEQLRRELSTLDINLQSSQAQLDSTQKSLAAGIDTPLIEQQVDQNSLLQNYRLQAEGTLQQLEGARDKWNDGHPIVQQAQKQYDRAKQKVADYEAEVRAKARAAILGQLQDNVGSQQAMVNKLNAQIQQKTEDLGDVTNQMMVYYTTEAAQKGNADQLKQVEDQLAFLEADQNQKLTGKVQWARTPELPTSRSFPQLKYTLPIAIAIGLTLALSIAFLREMTDTSVRTPRDIQRVGQITLLGMIGDESQDPQAAGARLPLVIFDAPHSMTAEQLRQVRTRLQHTASLDTTRSLLVTSPSPGDGKTTVACNMAAGLALNGRRILLVDGNFRRPEIHKIFAVANDQGFSDVLNGAVSFDEVVQETQVPNLAVMTSGPKPINATEMFESQLLMDFIERALEEFDHVIFDSGPMMVVSESTAMAPRVDGVITVVRARTNSRGLLTRMRETLRAIKAEHLGVILNGVRTHGGGYYASSIKTYYEYQNT